MNKKYLIYANKQKFKAKGEMSYCYLKID